MKKIIGLVTDFGTKDSYVGVMKAIMLTIAADVQLIDISHSIHPFNILSASYVLLTAWDYFPKGSVFLSVVDPGVGTARKTLLYIYDDKFLVTPDNGTISMLKRMHGEADIFFVSEQTIKEVSLSPIRNNSNSQPFTASTFHGRDIFSPLAAHIADTGMDSIKTEDGDPVLIQSVWPEINIEKRIIKSRIIHIDRFGNCITSIHYNDLSRIQYTSIRINLGYTTITDIKKCFSDVLPGEPLVYFGSSGFLEIAVRQGNAAQVLKIIGDSDILIHLM